MSPAPDDPLRRSLAMLPGVGPSRLKALGASDLRTFGDLLWHLPFRFEDRNHPATVAGIRAGESRMLFAQVKAIRTRRGRRRGLAITEALLSDATGSIHALWFNQPYLDRTLPAGSRAYFFGPATLYATRAGLRLQLDNPEVEKEPAGGGDPIHSGRIVPVYRKAGDLGSRSLRTLIHGLLGGIEIPEVLPGALLRGEGLQPRDEAFRGAHFPPAEAPAEDLRLRRTPAFRRLVFEELLLFQLALQRMRRSRGVGAPAEPIAVGREERARVGALLPFVLTAAQKRVLREIAADLSGGEPMYRLLQGDVGSGKTAVAFVSMLLAAMSGRQAAFLAPTEILAQQQFARLGELASAEGFATVLLTASSRTKERKEALDALREGAATFAVGTHSLFQDGVEYRDLGLVVVDEQHRFGVGQRARMVAKGRNPHVLVMSATPIPRSLAMTLYGDLDLSVLDELPPGRAPVATAVRSEAARPRVEAFLRAEMEGGRQAFVVYPQVEESEASDLRAATEAYERLRLGPFRDFPLALLHGRMSGKEKSAVMEGFRSGALRMLVTTSVVEVGVDLPEASVIVVEHAERFGLAQLHQLRGRVGRGGARGYCILFPSKDAGAPGMERLAVLERTRDGFAVAEEDLRLRGAGDPGGVRQWGGGGFRVANPIRDFDILERTREWAVRLAQDEVDLSAEEKARLEGWLASAGTQGGAFSGIG